MMKNYSDQVFTELLKLFRDDDVSSREWLLQNNYKELVEFHYAIEGKEKSFEWLMENGHRILASTVDGLSGAEGAKIFLIRSGHREMSAFIDAAKGNKAAVNYLIKQGHKGLIQLAHEIYVRNKKEEKKGIWGLLSFGNPFR